MHNQIYLVEDDQGIVKIVSENLKKWGYQVRFAVDFQAIVTDVKECEPDLIILDISLPFFNGYHWCTEIRKFSKVPILFLSSADDAMNIVMAMNVGGDDYITKPFDLSVLVAKIQALLRRTYDFSESSDVLVFQEYQLHLVNNTVCLGSECVELTGNESKILQLLFESPEKIVPKETIMERLWQSDEFVDSNTLAVNMNRLRKKVADIALDRLIQTKKGIGYLLDEE